MLNIKRTISAATAAVILLTGSAMPVQPAVSADTIFAPGMMQNSFGMHMTSFSGGNNYFLLGGSRNGENRIPVGRQYYSHSKTVMKMANDFCTVGSGLFVGNTVFSSSADYQFVFDDFGQSLQFYGDVYHEMTGDLSFSASVSPDTIDRFRMENNGTIPYTAQPYVYIDGMLDVGEDKLAIGTADDVSNVNLICGGLDTYAQIGDGNHVRIRGDVFLTDPEAESVLARTVEIMGMMPEYVQPAAVPWGELHGGSIICNNRSLLVTNPNKEKVIDGDLIMTNPQGKLVVEAPLTVNGRIICAGAIEGTENIQCTEIITPASDVNFFKNYMDPSYGDYEYSSSYGFPLLPFSFRPDEMFDKYIRWDLQAGTAEDARKLMETDPLVAESADCGHMWDIMEVYAKNRERVEYTGGSDRTVIYYDEDAFEHRNDANVITYKEETCYDDLGNYHYAYAEILIPDSGYANISEEDAVVYVPYTTALSGKAFIQHYEPVTEENLLPEEYQIDDINLFKDLMEGLAGGEVPTISLSEKRVIPVVYHDTKNAEECSESIEAYPVTESCILDFTQNYATVFIDPFRRDYTPDRPMCILLRNMPMDGKIIINNTARYGTDYQSYESLARHGEAAPRRQVLFFLDSTNTNHMEKPCVFCSGAYGQCGNGPTGRGEGDFRIVSNPYYPWTEGWEELPSAFKYAYELVPNAAIFGEADAEYQMLNYVFFNADILMPSSRISISGNAARSQYIYRSEPDSSPRMSQGSYGEALTFLDDVVCNQIDSDRMTVVQLNDAHRSATEVLPPYEAVRGEWENMIWTFDSEGVLTISGEGDMPEIESQMEYPWNPNRGDIKKVIIEPGITNIGRSAFKECTNLTSITIPDSVTSIGNYAFARTNLTSISIPESVTSIGRLAFAVCKNLTNITIPDSVTSIGDGAFEYCESLTSITIPEGIQSIESGTFNGCKNLTSITIPESVTSIGTLAFCICEKLESITILNQDCTIAYSTLKGSTICNDDNDGECKFRGTIYGYTGSTAQTYAQDHSCKFVALDAAETTAAPTVTTAAPVTTTAKVTTTVTTTAEVTAPVLLGDVDENGYVDLSDAQLIQAYVTAFDKSTHNIKKAAADINADGEIDMTDAALVFRYYIMSEIAKNTQQWDALVSKSRNQPVSENALLTVDASRGERDVQFSFSFPKSAHVSVFDLYFTCPEGYQPELNQYGQPKLDQYITVAAEYDKSTGRIHVTGLSSKTVTSLFSISLSSNEFGLEANLQNVSVRAYDGNGAEITPVNISLPNLPKWTTVPETTEQPVITTEPPVITTEQPVTTSEPPVITTEQPVTTSEPPVTTSEPPVTTSEPPVITTEQPVTTSEPPVTTSEPPVTTSEPPVTTTMTETTAAPAQPGVMHTEIYYQYQIDLPALAEPFDADDEKPFDLSELYVAQLSYACNVDGEGYLLDTNEKPIYENGIRILYANATEQQKMNYGKDEGLLTIADKIALKPDANSPALLWRHAEDPVSGEKFNVDFYYYADSSDAKGTYIGSLPVTLNCTDLPEWYPTELREEADLTSVFPEAAGASEWHSSDERVATVDAQGHAKFLKGGYAKITANAGGKQFVCRVVPDMRGDVMIDNEIDLGDALKTLKAYTMIMGDKQPDLSEKQFAHADIDNDGAITLQDAMMILRYSTMIGAGLQPTWDSIIKKAKPAE